MNQSQYSKSGESIWTSRENASSSTLVDAYSSEYSILSHCKNSASILRRSSMVSLPQNFKGNNRRKHSAPYSLGLKTSLVRSSYADSANFEGRRSNSQYMKRCNSRTRGTWGTSYSDFGSNAIKYRFHRRIQVSPYRNGSITDSRSH